MVFRTEREFQRWACKIAMDNGWMVYCHPDSRKTGGLSTKGFPDTVFVKITGVNVYIIELKHGANKPKPEQRLWMKALNGKVIRAQWVSDRRWKALKRVLEG